MTSGLPNWYQFADPGDTQIDVDQWRDYAARRLNRFTQKEKWTVSDTSWMDGEASKLSDDAIEEIGGHLLLRIAASQDPRAETWIVEEEGDLFEYRYGKAGFDDRLLVARDLMGEGSVLTVEELELKWNGDPRKREALRRLHIMKRKQPHGKRQKLIRARGSSELDVLAVHFSQIPQLVSKRSVLLAHGWGISEFRTFKGALKRKFEQKLRDAIRASRKLAEEWPKIKAIAADIAKVSKELARTGSSGLTGVELSLGGKTITEVHDILPPCVRHMISILMEKGHLNHVERIQLGLFLKRVGMSVDDQIQFWYHIAVDNVGVSLPEFTKKIGYQIKHLYGLVGAKIDYEPPKCKTCIDGYYCHFAHADWPSIDEDLNSNMKELMETTEGKHAYRRIVDRMSRADPQGACAGFLQLTTGVQLPRIYSMTHYMKRALQSIESQQPETAKEKTPATDKEKEKEQDSSPENDGSPQRKDDQNSTGATTRQTNEQESN